MRTETMLGTLATEAARFEEPEGQGTPAQTMFRPVGTPLRNDGVWQFWMDRGNIYRLGWDGTGWRVICDTWLSGHVRRLAESQDFAFVEQLTLTEGVLELNRSRTYEIRELETPGTWGVFS